MIPVESGSPPLSLRELQRLKRELLSERGSSSDDRRSLRPSSSSSTPEENSSPSDFTTPPRRQVGGGQGRIGRLTSREKLTRLSFGQDLGKPADPDPVALAPPLPTTPVNDGDRPLASHSLADAAPPAASPILLLAPINGRRFRKKHASVSSEFLDALDKTSWGRAKGKELDRPHSRSVGAVAGKTLLQTQSKRPHRPAAATNKTAASAAGGPPQTSLLGGQAPARAKGTGKRYASLPPSLFVPPPPQASIPFPTAPAPRSPLPPAPAPAPPVASSAPPPAAPVQAPLDDPEPVAGPEEPVEEEDQEEEMSYHPNDYQRTRPVAPSQDRPDHAREAHRTMGPKKGQQLLRQQQQQGLYSTAFSEDECDEEEEEDDLSTEDEYGHHHHPYAQGGRPREGRETYAEEDLDDDDGQGARYSPGMIHEDPRRNIYQEADFDHPHHHLGGPAPAAPATGGQPAGGGGVPVGPDGLPVRGWDAIQSHHNSRLPPPLDPQGPMTTSAPMGGQQVQTVPAEQVFPPQQQPQQPQQGARSRRPSLARPAVRGAPNQLPPMQQPLGPQPPAPQPPPGAEYAHHRQPVDEDRRGEREVEPHPDDDRDDDVVRRYLASMRSEGALPPDFIRDEPRPHHRDPAGPSSSSAYPPQQAKPFHPLPPTPIPTQAPLISPATNNNAGGPVPAGNNGGAGAGFNPSSGVHFPRQERHPLVVGASPVDPLHQQPQPTTASPIVTGPPTRHHQGPPKTNASKAAAGDGRPRKGSGGVSSPPGSNRARLGHGHHHSASGRDQNMLPLGAVAAANTGLGNHPTGTGTGTVRKRRVSDGSITGGLRKDQLLAKMAEALSAEREKAALYAKEFNEAEREIDELAITIDEMKKQHAKTVSLLKKEIGGLKKEREALVQALEEAECIDDEEANRYLSLLDPAQAALLHGTSEIDETEEDEEEPARPGGGPGGRSRDPVKGSSRLDPAGTVRAQMQEKAAQRQQRINAAMSRLAPESNPDLVPSSGTGKRDATSSAEDELVIIQGGPRKHRSSGNGGGGPPGSRGIVRRLSKRRPDSRQSRDGASNVGPAGGGGGRPTSSGGPYGFFRGRRNSSASRRSEAEPVVRRSTGGLGGGHGHGRAMSASEMLDHAPAPSASAAPHNGSGFFDSGSLYPNRNGIDGGSRRGEYDQGGGGGERQKNKIGKLFRKVFPAYRDEDELTESEDDRRY